jgi:hypothetical protein
MTGNQLIIVQPWFTARGHPAQSLLNTARVLGKRSDVCYLISRQPHRTEFAPIIEELAEYGDIHQFRVPNYALTVGTVLSFWKLARIARQYKDTVDVFFMDSHLLTLAAGHPFFASIGRKVRLIMAIGLVGPESVVAKPWRRAMIERWLQSGDAKLFLRTNELTEAWRSAFPAVDGRRIETLPSLEIPEANELLSVHGPEGPTRFGILGQVRPGKGIDWLVPMFRKHPELGELRVSGTFFNDRHRAMLSELVGFPGFEDRYVPDEELLPRAASVDYLLTLYDSWDHRMEAATFYVAARAGRPVICYDQGWCGRMVREFGCGIALPGLKRPDAEVFRALPHRDSTEYRELVRGMEQFRQAHSGETWRAEFLRKLADGTTMPSDFKT